MLSSAHLRKAMITVFAANVLTWYEGSLFVLFSTVLGNVFFPQQSPLIALIHIFLLFSIGFVTRPIGTLFFSHIGDKIGRRTALIISIILMTVPTFGIGLTPSYAAIGFAAPFFILLMRLIQGFSTGGEFAGTMCYVYEIAPVHCRGFTGSLTFCASQLGNVFSTIEYLLLEKHLSFQTFTSWGWRISFLMGGLFGLLAWFLRYTLHETPLFEMMKTEGRTSQRPVIEAFKSQKLIMMKAFGLSSFTIAGWYTIFIFSPHYSKITGLNHRDLLIFNACLLCFSSLLMPLFGYLFDRHYKQTLFFASAITTFVISIPFYFAVSHHYFSIPLFIFTETVLSLLLTIQFAILPTLLAGLFPLRLRYTCLGISYNFCNVLFGGATPFVLLTFTEEIGFYLAPAILLMATALLSLWSYLKIKSLSPL